MGKLHSKHVCHTIENSTGECYLVNAEFTAVNTCGNIKIVDQFPWKPGTVSCPGDKEGGFFANKNAQTLTEDEMPLTVELPPQKQNSCTAQVLTMDQSEDTTTAKKKGEDKPAEKGVVKQKIKDSTVEEFQCGIMVDSDKQEWSFTLYDMDVQSKLSKEELADLIKSLYDAVGSNIGISETETGPRSMKLKLTVTPDNTQITHLDVKQKTPPSPNKHVHTINNLSMSSGVTKEVKINNLTRALQKLTVDKGESSSLPTEGQTVANGSPVDQTQCDTLKHSKKRQHKTGKGLYHRKAGGASGCVSRFKYNQEQLAELVRQNMDRHQRKQQQLRRHQSENKGHVTRRHRCRKHKEEEPCQENLDRRNYYLDLAGVENYNSTLIDFTSRNNSATATQLNTSLPANVRKSDRPKSCVIQDNMPKVRGRDTVRSHSQELPQSRSQNCDNIRREEPGKQYPVLERVSHSANISPKKGKRPRCLSPNRSHNMGQHQSRTRHQSMQENNNNRVLQWLADNPHEECDEMTIVHEHHHRHEHYHHHHYHHYPMS